MSIFSKYKTNQAISRLTEEMLYAQVAEEIQNGIRRDGLWAKAISEAELNEDKAKAIYIKLRVQSLIDEMNIAQEKTNKNPVAKKLNNKEKEKKEDFYKDSIGSTEKVLTCNNCNRTGKMLTKKTNMTLEQRILFILFAGSPGIIIGNLLMPSIESPVLALSIPISYLFFYFILFNKKHTQCPNCGNIGK